MAAPALTLEGLPTRDLQGMSDALQGTLGAMHKNPARYSEEQRRDTMAEYGRVQRALSARAIDEYQYPF